MKSEETDLIEQPVQQARGTTRRLSKDFALVVLCCRWPLTETVLAAIRDMVADVDFTRVVRIADRHRVQGLVYAALRAAKVALPMAAEASLAASARQIALRGIKMAAEASRLAHLASQAEIPILILKGAPLAQLAYGTVALKHASDIDLAIAPTDLARARALLSAAGYAARPVVVAKDEPWMNSAQQILVELHTGLVNHPSWLSAFEDGTSVQNVSIGASTVPTLDPDRLFAYLCVHGASHCWSRLKWLADFAALTAALSPADITRCYARAVRWGAGRSVGQAVILSAELFGMRLEPDFEARLRRDPVVRCLIWNAYHSFSKHNETEELDARALSTLRIHLAQLVFTQGWRNRATLLVGKLRTRQPGDTGPPPSVGFWPIQSLRWVRRRFQRRKALRARASRSTRSVRAVDPALQSSRRDE